MVLRIPVETVLGLVRQARGLERMSETLAGALVRPDRGREDNAAGWTSAVHMYFESPALRAFHRSLNALPDTMQAELIALMWLGRGDIGAEPERWNELLSRAWAIVEDADVLKLVGRNRLSVYLEAGLRRVGAI